MGVAGGEISRDAFIGQTEDGKRRLLPLMAPFPLFIAGDLAGSRELSAGFSPLKLPDLAQVDVWRGLEHCGLNMKLRMSGTLRDSVDRRPSFWGIVFPL
jgi:hypothetical protein